jgi:hypothetical protein
VLKIQFVFHTIYPKIQEAEVKASILPTLTILVSKFKEPLYIIKKRDNKLLDYDRCKSIKARGDSVCICIHILFLRYGNRLIKPFKSPQTPMYLSMPNSLKSFHSL